MLYIVATPIGNLDDISFRAVETLKSCDYILCEDSRHSLILLKHYQIHKPLKSFHKFSESAKQNEIIEDLKNGLQIALISDAGTPGISDPGTKLIHACIENQIRITPVPGACAAITALTCSGMATDRFQFLGFLPRKSGDLKKMLIDLLSYSGTTICYESPNRLVNVLTMINGIDPDRFLVVARELTKKFEELQRGNATQLIDYWKAHPLKGEIVLLISGQSTDRSDQEEWSSLTPQEHVEKMQSTYGITRNEAILAVAKMRGVSKRTIYNEIHK